MSEFDEKTPQEPDATEAPETVETVEVVETVIPEPAASEPTPNYQQAPPPPQYGQPVYAAEPPLHVPSLVLGIVGIIITWFTIGIGGLICGIIGIVLSKRAKGQYRTTAGFVLSLVSVILSAIILIVIIIGFAILGTAALFGLAALG